MFYAGLQKKSITFNTWYTLFHSQTLIYSFL
uniref:Uncharacterized protein n=1 Tax=Arundo donax TaxID=35708 RepID=A0A0A9PSY0_ARUDO